MMAEKNNSTCSICGTKYYACLSCHDSIQLTPWKVHTDTSEHFKVFQIVRGFNTGVYSKDEAKEKFKNVDLSDLNTFRPHIKSIIEEILKEEKPIVENTVAYRKRNYKIEKINTDEKIDNENVECVEVVNEDLNVE